MKGLTISLSPPEDLRELYEPVLWGSPGGLRYRAEAPDPKHFPKGTQWVAVRDSEGLCAAAVLAPMATAPVNMALRLVVAERTQGRGMARELARVVWKQLERPVVGTIEADNIRSLRTAQSVGAALLGRCEARVITHRGRTSDNGVHRGRAEAVPEGLQPLLEQVDPASIWSSRCSGSLLVRHQWEVTTLGGRTGHLALRALKPLGVDASNFVFLSAHGCWGEPRDLQSVFSTAMAAERADAVIVVATAGSARSRLHQQLRRGVGGRIAGTSRWDVMGTQQASWTLFEPLATR